ncbi:MAG: gliding motility-associated ABC transporter substrate-binding protein GldG [Chitinophagaceae bacterium]|nr:gliding motility-associated ABC transporter substrate-binding protein GldG [Chitinophagaceae bacterium]
MNSKRTYKREALIQLSIVIGIVVALNVLSSAVFTRVDLTADKRFTLTDSTRQLLRKLDDVVFVKIYLEGDFPAGFKRLANGTKELLNEFKVYGGDKIQYEFEDPTKGKNDKELQDILKELAQKGLEPTNVKNNAGDEYSEKIIVPGAIVNYKGHQVAVNLLENTPGTVAQEALNNSIAHLEDKFSQAIESMSLIRAPKIGFIRGHGEMNNIATADLTTTMSAFYDLRIIYPDSVTEIAKDFKAIVIAKPTKTFSEQDKFKIDQYLMNGGKILWLVEALNAELDTVIARRSFLTVDYPLNLEDQLFRYGIRVNPALVLDLQCNPVPLLVSYEGTKPKFNLFPCYYFPVFAAGSTHPIDKGITAVSSSFASSLDTLALKGVQKTVLLSSSDHSKLVFTPWMVDFKELKSRPDESQYNKKKLISAVLLEGTFPSVFANRIAPEMLTTLNDSLKMPFREKSVETKMIVIADGDIAKNEVNAQGQPLTLGYYRFTGEYFSNKNFLLNCIDYLTGFTQHIDTRSKTVQLRLLDNTKVTAEKTKWQLINTLVPIGLLIVFGLMFNFIRNRKFAH